MQPFISQQALLELLQESGLDQILQLQEGEEFLVETAYLEHWNRDLDHRPKLDGLSEFSADPLPDNEGVQITVEFTDDEQVIMIYHPSPDTPGQYGLEIVHNDDLVYCRTSDQDPATEWQMNCMADNVEAAATPDGTPLFKSDQLNI